MAESERIGHKASRQDSWRAEDPLKGRGEPNSPLRCIVETGLSAAETRKLNTKNSSRGDFLYLVNEILSAT